MPGDEWIRCESLVHPRVFHDKYLPLQNSVRAKREVARSFAHRYPYLGLEPLAIAINQGNGGDFGSANLGGLERYVVKCLLWIGIEDIVPVQRFLPLGFLGW